MTLWARCAQFAASPVDRWSEDHNASVNKNSDAKYPALICQVPDSKIGRLGTSQNGRKVLIAKVGEGRG